MYRPRYILCTIVLAACACSSDVPLPPQKRLVYDNSQAEIVSSSVAAKPTWNASLPSAVFCKKERWKDSLFAGRILTDGSLDFGISVWEKQSGKNFSVQGVAQRVGRIWIYQEGKEEDACRIKIAWTLARAASIDVDPIANCEPYAGVNFGEKSARFDKSDYKKTVTNELGKNEEFMRADPCKNSPVSS